MSASTSATPMTCPKCGDAQPPATACRRCGLAADHMNAYAASSVEIPPVILAMWAKVEASWTDTAVHDAFINAASAANLFTYAARQYRAAGAARPGDDVAPGHLTRLARMAEAAMRATASPPPRDAKRLRVIVLVIVAAFLLAMVGLLVAKVMSQPGAAGPPPPPGAHAPSAPPAPR